MDKSSLVVQTCVETAWCAQITTAKDCHQRDVSENFVLSNFLRGFDCRLGDIILFLENCFLKNEQKIASFFALFKAPCMLMVHSVGAYDYVRRFCFR